MRIEGVGVHDAGEFCELHATVVLSRLAEPFRLWYRFPAELARQVDAHAGDTLVAALLLPAMATGEALDIPLPVSPKLARALPSIQDIFHCWDPTLHRVDTRLSARTPEPLAASAVGLFFSAGVDAFYTLYKNKTARRDDDEITHLLVVHGIDIHVGDWKQDVYRKMLRDTHELCAKIDKTAVPIATNLKRLTARLAIPWGTLAHGAALASIGLALGRHFKSFYIAAGETYRNLTPAGTHPLLDPLWSTETCTFVHDGCEANRLDKVRFLIAFPDALDRLRVCWAQERAEFNCGRCSKCLRTLLAFYLSDALGKCRTLPDQLDTMSFRSVPLLNPYEYDIFGEFLDALGDSETDRAIEENLTAALERHRPYFQRLKKIGLTLGRLIPPSDRFILVDRDAIREKIGAGREALPFLERNGEHNGLPKDDETAIGELERMRRECAKFLVFWWAERWWLDHYRGFADHVRRHYFCIQDDEAALIFALDRPAERD